MVLDLIFSDWFVEASGIFTGFSYELEFLDIYQLQTRGGVRDLLLREYVN